MKISIGADERLTIVEAALEILEERGDTVTYYGPEAEGTQPWPQVARQVAEDVAHGRSEEGILFCWTGTGVSMAANKVPGVRAALCFDAEIARGARLWNNANVLCISMRLTSEIMLEEIIEAWFETQYIPNETDEACLLMIDELDDKRNAMHNG
ncbi:RpiB/LacA/LacB family sugar-phosphate isomerase [bacterium]|nr:RpiB/LacA/LacB family sugar-phosphate isomerase [bacterium]MCB2179302.1 RpiB/LacA/LacB family sugar-phosphate isomerase [bacterium]